MSAQRLKDWVDPVRLAQRGETLEGSVELAQMKRLAPYLAQTGGRAEARLEFGVDQQGTHYLHGRIRAELVLTCQRCLEPMYHVVDAEVWLGIIGEEAEAELLPERYDPLPVGEEPLFLRDVIEDELILSLPIVPKHAEGACGAAEGNEGRARDRNDGSDAGEEEAATDGRENPFAILAALKNDGKP